VKDGILGSRQEQEAYGQGWPLFRLIGRWHRHAGLHDNHAYLRDVIPGSLASPAYRHAGEAAEPHDQLMRLTVRASVSEPHWDVQGGSMGAVGAMVA
jgi:hypothetical protein